MLTDRYNHTFLKKHLLSQQQWRPFPQANDRNAWECIASNPHYRGLTQFLIQSAEQWQGVPWPTLPATLYMEFVRTGNRSHYEQFYFERRQRLAAFVLAECLEYRGRFLDDVVNGLWEIMGEVTWCIPAHARQIGPDYYTHDPLPRQSPEFVDLFACETAMVLAESLYLLQHELETLSFALCERLRSQILNRVVIPVETHYDFWWMKGELNWGPWCASNALGAAMYLIDDPARLALLSYKLMGVVERFIGTYGADGGCDEGPMYWGVAAGAMLIFLELLHSRTNGAVDIYDEPLIQNMGRFIVSTHLAGKWFANFADASAQIAIKQAVTYRYGERIQDTSMQQLALAFAANLRATSQEGASLLREHTGAALIHILRDLFWMPAERSAAANCQAETVWLPDVQVLLAREQPEDGQGLVLAAKGGHNGENHNHNDLGHCIIFLDGQPGIIDIGRATYTRQTFGPERYQLWFTRAAGHNAPIVNGVEQAAGRKFQVSNVAFTENETTQTLSMNLETAYPPEAGLRSLRRTITFEHGNPARIHIQDTFETESDAPTFEVNLFTPQQVRMLQAGTLLIQTQPRLLLLTFDPEHLRVEIAAVSVDDPTLRDIWGEQLRKIAFTCRHAGRTGDYSLLFRASDCEAR
ncbi:hypothetical protein U14_03457 [Candidatus Moduliflexus flocculans]|uniref:Heparinase II/III-like C-terminal domain-containing protein n=1 Tax=Candidatus Moduliflexus flocculans TaxID=1499966 RepID=A0A081BP90_9BACT|nr:hypothetical protein U14_03457 [Candidatus Moduliflexus flocculans]